MWSSLINKLPSRQLFLANCLFWLLLNTIAALHSYRMQLHYEKPAVFTDIWLEYLPWWGNWIFIAPLVFAATSMITFDKNRPAQFIILNVISSFILCSAYWLLTIVEVALIKKGYINLEILQHAFERLLLSPMHIDFLVYLAIFCTGYSITYYTRAKQQTRKSEVLSKQLLQVELQSLRSQLNPHFLFNTLNSVAGLIRLDEKQKAVKALSELSLMLRKVLENQNNQLIPLQQEIDFIQSYLTIQKMRFEDKLETQFVIEGDYQDCHIPFMLLQPLVENAIQHGCQLESNKNTLTINITVDHDKLHFILINKLPETDQHQGFGIGIKNCRLRLEKLFNDYTFSLTELDNSYFKTSLTLPVGAQND